MQSSLASLIIAVFKKNSVEHTWRLSLLSAIQFTIKSLISSVSQRLIEIVFVGQLQTLLEISHRKNNFGEFNRKLDATNIK